MLKMSNRFTKLSSYSKYQNLVPGVLRKISGTHISARLIQYLCEFRTAWCQKNKRRSVRIAAVRKVSDCITAYGPSALLVIRYKKSSIQNFIVLVIYFDLIAFFIILW